MAKTNNSRRYPGESTKCRPDFAEARRQEAAERKAKYDALSPKEKLDNLDLKFGAGQGAKKERARLLAAMQSPKKAPVVKEELAVATIPDEIMAEIDALNEESSNKRKVKAKDRRSRNHKST